MLRSQQFEYDRRQVIRVLREAQGAIEATLGTLCPTHPDRMRANDLCNDIDAFVTGIKNQQAPPAQEGKA